MRLKSLLAASAALMLAPLAAAHAAPQTLLLVAADKSLPLNCEYGVCAAEATSLCLEYSRATPVRGTPYTVVPERDGEILYFVGHTADGEMKSIPASTMLDVVAHREHLSVRLSIPQAKLAETGLVDARIEVRKNAILAPIPDPTDTDVQSFADLALAQGPLRATAERIMTERKDAFEAAETVADMLNNLPRRTIAGTEMRGRVADEVIAENVAKGTLAAANADTVREVIGRCDHVIDEKMWWSGFHRDYVSRYRHCLEYRHNDLIEPLNRTYWERLEGAGS